MDVPNWLLQQLIQLGDDDVDSDPDDPDERQDGEASQAELQRLAASGETTPPEHDIWWGFSSTSTSLPAVQSFLGQAGPRVIFTVDGGSSRSSSGTAVPAWNAE